MHAGKDYRQFFGIAFGDGAYCPGIFRCRVFDEIEGDFAALFVKCVAGAHIFQFNGGAYVACAKFVDRCLNLAAHTVNLCETLFAATGYVVEVGTGIQGA